MSFLINVSWNNLKYVKQSNSLLSLGHDLGATDFLILEKFIFFIFRNAYYMKHLGVEVEG